MKTTVDLQILGDFAILDDGGVDGVRSRNATDPKALLVPW